MVVKANTELMKNTKKWYVIYTKPKCERVVQNRLNELGFETYLPLSRELHRWNDREKWIEKPLFTSYVFLMSDTKTKNKVFEVFGILNFVSFNGKPANIHEDEIDRIRLLCKFFERVDIEYDIKNVGRKIEIMDGLLKGMRGTLVYSNSTSALRISIDSLNCFASVRLDNKKINLRYIK